jgi:methylated-DNA-[protein]-cysteine S-methyltransferase
LIWRTAIDSPIGTLLATCTAEGLTALTFDPPADAESSEAHPLLRQLESELRAYFAKDLKHFSVPLAPQGTPFQLQVWTALQKVDYGSTRSYLEQSKVVGDPKAIRAVAHANGQNPIAILIPCHRIVGSDGTLTGYAGGLWRKKFLLDLESEQQSLF